MRQRMLFMLALLLTGALHGAPVTLHWRVTTSGPSVEHGSDHYGIFAVAGAIADLEGYTFTIAPDNTSLAVAPKGDAPAAQVFSVDALNGRTTRPGKLVPYGRKSTYAAFGSPFTIELTTAFEPTDCVTFVVFNGAWYFSPSRSGYALLTVRGLSAMESGAMIDLSEQTLQWMGETVPARLEVTLPR